MFRAKAVATGVATLRTTIFASLACGRSKPACYILEGPSAALCSPCVTAARSYVRRSSEGQSVTQQMPPLNPPGGCQFLC